MKTWEKTLVTATLGLSLGGLGLGSASAMPANGAVAIDTAQRAATALPLEHVQYYGYGYPCVFPYRCGYRYYRPGFYGPGLYGRGFYGRGYYGRGYGRGFYGRGRF